MMRVPQGDLITTKLFVVSDADFQSAPVFEWLAKLPALHILQEFADCVVFL